MSILDISKTKMYAFHYGYIKPKYGSQARLLFTDTDSLAYEIQTEDFYKDITPDVKKFFDTSRSSIGNPDWAQQKIPGLFKDEAGSKQIAEFVGLRGKLHSFRKHKGSEEKKCKGIKKCVLEKKITFDDYKQCLFKEPQMRTMNVIRSYGHEVYTEEVNKVALDSKDDKRIILKDKIHTHAHGYLDSTPLGGN